MRIGAALGVLAGALAVAGTPTAEAHPAPLRLTVDSAAATGDRVNRGLVGVNWDGERPQAVRPLRPGLARVDAQIERLFPDGPELDRDALARLNSSLDAILRAGAEPLVILSYMPPWLADAQPGDPRDRTKLPPRDPQLWGDLVGRVVSELSAGRAARGQRPARRFEVWNEPDWPVFFQDSPQRFLEDVFVPSAAAVAAVEREHRIDLLFGGCACVAPDPLMIVPMVTLARQRGLPLDFVSWHWYANTPFLGPDGREPLGTPEFQQLVDVVFPFWGRRNPVATPASYGDQVGLVREWVRGALAGSGRPMPELVIDEWNLSAGGFDRRMDIHEGAAYDGGVLAEMQKAGLDRSAVFRAVDPAYFADPKVNPSGEEHRGGWGLVTITGRRKPAWWTFWLWRRLAPLVVRSQLESARSDGVWALASRGARRRRLTVLVASFLAEGAHPHELALELSGLPPGRWRIRIRRIDAGHPSARRADRRARRIRRGERLDLELELPAQALVAVELRR